MLLKSALVILFYSKPVESQDPKTSPTTAHLLNGKIRKATKKQAQFDVKITYLATLTILSQLQRLQIRVGKITENAKYKNELNCNWLGVKILHGLCSAINFLKDP